MMGPVDFGDPTDPNLPVTEPFIEAPPYYAGQYDGYPAAFNGYNGYPGGYGTYDGYLATAVRPGEVVTAAVLSLITAGLLLITGFVVIFAASSLETADSSVE